MDDDMLLLDRDQIFLAQTPDHAVDVARAETEHLGHDLLRQWQYVGKLAGKADSAKTDQHLIPCGDRRSMAVPG